ncbi:MAG TPA: hypothetical protein VIN10_07180 [Bacteroidales bacterium]
MKTFKISFFVVLLVSGILISGCSKDDTPNQPAPQLPPESSFVMDFTGFDNPNDTTSSREIASYQNWGYSYINVTVWHTLLKIGLAVPVASFLESFKHEAVFHPDQENWTWSYNFVVGGVTHEAELTGFFLNDTINWEMRITKANFYSDFLWYSGKSAFDRSGGYWILNEKPDSPNPILQIDWVYEGNSIGNIQYTNIKTGDAENGSYINYGTASGDLDRFYNLYFNSSANLTEIEWNSIDFHGRVKNAQHFGDQNWHCWDNTLQDIDCP